MTLNIARSELHTSEILFKDNSNPYILTRYRTSQEFNVQISLYSGGSLFDSQQVTGIREFYLHYSTFTAKFSLCLIKHHAKKMWMYNLNTRWRWVGSFTLQPPYPRERAALIMTLKY